MALHYTVDMGSLQFTVSDPVLGGSGYNKHLVIEFDCADEAEAEEIVKSLFVSSLATLAYTFAD